jgi:hypothetical protein
MARAELVAAHLRALLNLVQALRQVLHLALRQVLHLVGHGALLLQVALHRILEVFLVQVVCHLDNKDLDLSLVHNHQVEEVGPEEVHRARCKLSSREYLDRDLRWIWVNHSSHKCNNHLSSSSHHHHSRQGHLTWKKVDRDLLRVFQPVAPVIEVQLMRALVRRAECHMEEWRRCPWKAEEMAQEPENEVHWQSSMSKNIPNHREWKVKKAPLDKR